MPKSTGSDFSTAAGSQKDNDKNTGGLTFVIRTDARHATRTLKENLRQHFSKAAAGADPSQQVEAVIHGAYQDWGHRVLQALHESIDYSRYELEGPATADFQADFYNARALAGQAVTKAGSLAEAVQGPNKTPAIYVSLDDMIEAQKPHWSEIAFSRLFTLDGNSHLGYQARPGHREVGEQIQALRAKAEALSTQHGGEPAPIILLEDNVRHARMLNWVIDLMEEGGVFDHGVLAGISTCFCCAPEDEREAIRHRGKVVPLAIVVDYRDEKVDVITPRDLLFDGYVVEVEGEKKRLPAPFMNLEKMFKIAPAEGDHFRQKVQDANLAFCQTVESAFRIDLPLKWFATAEAIAYKTGQGMDTPMAKVLKDHTGCPPPGNNDNNSPRANNGPCQKPTP